MWKYIRQYKKQNIILAVLILMINLIYTLFAFFQMSIGKMIMTGNFKMLVLLMAANGLLGVSWNYLLYLQKKYQANTIMQMNQALRRDISQNIIHKSFQDFDQRDTGEYISWYTNDVKEAENQGFTNFYSCIELIFQLVWGMLALIFIRVEILLLTLLVSGVSLYVSNHFSKKVEKFSEKVTRAMECFTNHAKEQITGIGVLRAFGILSQFDKKMVEAGEELERERFLFVKKRGLENYKASLISIIGINGINILTFALCALRIIAPEVIFGSINLTNQVGSSFSALIEMKIRMAGAKPYFEKLKEEGKTVSVKPELPKLEQCIRTEKLTFGYSAVPVLRNLNLQFAMGGKYAIVGKSGCGKSTLLKLLMGQLAGYQGKILLDGKEAGTYDTDSFYQQIAYIEQNVFLFNTTIRENITLGDPFADKEVNEALKKSALLQDMEHFPNGLDTIVGEDGKNLSGGQKQRIAVARAIIHNCSILIVDEGTSALDQENAQRIEDALLACDDLTLIMVSHHLREDKVSCYNAVYHLTAACN